MRFNLRGQEGFRWFATGLIAAIIFAAPAPARANDGEDEPAVNSVEAPADESAANEESQDAPPTAPIDETDSEQPATTESESPSAEPNEDHAPQQGAMSGDDQPMATDAAPAELSPESPQEPLSPPAEAEDSDVERPSVDPTSLKGVHPGKTTRDELHVLWGTPKRIEKVAGGLREAYEMEPFSRVRVTVVEDVVESLAIQIDRPIALDAMVRRLQIEDLEPVQVFDDQGQLLGRAYPERGMLFGFTPQSGPPHVFQIVVEQIDAQPFLARAEVRLSTRYADCLADLNQALELSPQSSRAHWLHAQLTLRAGELEQSLKSARKALELEPKDGEYRLTLADVLAEADDYPRAISEIRDLVESGKLPKILLAKAYCQWGDCLAASQDRDYPQAMQHHQKAIQLAEPLASSKSVAERRAAKELLVAAHLSLAHDIGWGRWQQKAKVVPKWIERASVFADDVIAHEDGSLALRLRVSEQALAALAGIAEPPDADKWLKNALALGKKLIDEATDPSYQAYQAWRLGTALCDAVEIECARNHSDKALELGKLALGYLEQGGPAGKELPTHDYLRGRLCYRLGAIFAIQRSDHKQAVSWYDQAVPRLETPVPVCAAVDPGRHGEAFVSMAVSYWETSNRPEALRLTNQGLKLMEQAAGDGLLSQSALAVPYANLANMHEQMGDVQNAKRFSELAARSEKTAPQ